MYRSDWLRNIARTESLCDLNRREPVGCETHGIEPNRNFTLPSAILLNRGDSSDGSHAIDQALGSVVELSAIVFAAMNGKRNNRDVIHRKRRNQRRRRARRQIAQVGRDRIVEIDERLRRIVTNVKENGHDRGIAQRCRIDMFDAGHFGENAFTALRDEALDLARRRAGILRRDDCRGHRNLRIFLPRGREDRKQTPHGYCNDDCRRELGLQKIPR